MNLWSSRIWLLALPLVFLHVGCMDNRDLVQCTDDGDCGPGSLCTEDGLCVPLEDVRREGQNAGECSDAADNDLDGLYDCDDPDCEGSPDCPGSGDDDDDDASAGGDDDDDDDDDDDASAGVGGCAGDERVEEYVVGEEKLGAQGLVRFRMGSLNPDPVEVGDNGWNLSLHDAVSSEPLTGCTLEATPFMPDHNHGSNNPTATEGTEAGDYEFTDIAFIMSGYWEVTLNASCPGIGGADSLMVTFCIDG